VTRRRVVITGLGAVTPCGNDVPATWASLLKGRSGIGPVTRFDASGMPTRIAGEVKDFDGSAVVGPRRIRRMGLFMQYALAAGFEAVADAGFDKDGGPWPDAERFGVYVGSGIGGFPEIVDGARAMDAEGLSRISPFFIPRSLINLATGHLSIELGAQGPTLCIATACAVGNHSIGEAWRAIALGDADVILAGGAEASISPLGMGGFMAMRALSKRNDEPTRASRPFDVGRDGFVMGEGAGIVLLEDYEHAKARGARIYCELIGYGATTDAHHITAPAPHGAGAARCMAAALRSAGLAPEEVGYINAHGTSTPLNDSHETAAIKTVFGEHAYALGVSSTKSLTGHLLGASGGVEAVATAMSVFTGTCHGTANLDHPDSQCDLDYLREGARDLRPRVALSNAFGFGGTNATLVFARVED
jgi:3-oxoacyl-[acyl-carrier-protein] synthase II